jgi:hypothetical protein
VIKFNYVTTTDLLCSCVFEVCKTECDGSGRLLKVYFQPVLLDLYCSEGTIVDSGIFDAQHFVIVDATVEVN